MSILNEYKYKKEKKEMIWTYMQVKFNNYLFRVLLCIDMLREGKSMAGETDPRRSTEKESVVYSFSIYRNETSSYSGDALSSEFFQLSFV